MMAAPIPVQLSSFATNVVDQIQRHRPITPPRPRPGIARSAGPAGRFGGPIKSGGMPEAATAQILGQLPGVDEQHGVDANR
jgi:hypothetical protein